MLLQPARLELPPSKLKTAYHHDLISHRNHHPREIDQNTLTRNLDKQSYGPTQRATEDRVNYVTETNPTRSYRVRDFSRSVADVTTPQN